MLGLWHGACAKDGTRSVEGEYLVDLVGGSAWGVRGRGDSEGSLIELHLP